MRALNHSGTAAETVLASAVDDVGTTVIVQAVQAGSYPVAPFVITVDRGSVSEEKMVVSNVGVDLATFTVERGFDGTVPSAHAQAAKVEHTISAAEMQWSNDHLNSPAGHGVSSAIVGADEVQRLKNKTIVSSENDLAVAVSDIPELQQWMTDTEKSFVGRASLTAVIVLWAGEGEVLGWIPCDGGSFADTDYPELFAVIGEKFGSAGPGMFNVPNVSAPIPGLKYYIFDGKVAP